MKTQLRILLATAIAFVSVAAAQASEFNRPWLEDTAIVIDPYQGNPLDFDALEKDPRVAGIIHKATQGLKQDRRYSERRAEALRRGYLWGSYHLLTRGDPKAQIDHYLETVGIRADETYALDVECLPQTEDCQFESLKVAPEAVETALRHFKDQTGFYPLLYLNGGNRGILEARWAHTDEFDQVPLWYARFRNDISSLFPGDVWPSYELLQFASEINCGPGKNACPYDIPGIADDMDINLYWGNVETLKANWPLKGSPN